MSTPHPLCPEDRLAALLAAVRDNRPEGQRDLDTLLRTFPDDPRLHFLTGSLLAAKQDFAGARNAMRKAVDLAPDYAVARFQLGFLLLTSGEPMAAQEAWGPLHGLPANDHHRLFVEGLCHLIRDEFSDAIRSLEDGMVRNQQNLAMNGDMQLLIDEMRRKLADQDTTSISSVDLLLQQSALKSTRH